MSAPSNPFVHLIDQVFRLTGRLHSLFAELHDKTGLTKTEHLVLASVVDSATPPTASQIGRSLGYPRQGIQRAVNGLKAADLIDKQSNPNHKRAHLLVATPRGLELKRTTDRLALAIAEGFSGRIDTEKCHDIAEDLNDLSREIEAYLRNQGTGGY